MIRTHKPSGHHWTCASHFQQSKQYRNLNAQDWHAPSASILVADPDDDLPPSARVAKRRRVEQLANDFLDGQPLFISSACANGPDLTATVDKVLCDKRQTWDEVLDDYDEDLWADGVDGWAELRKRSKARAARKRSRSQPQNSRRSTRSQAEDVVKSCAATSSDYHPTIRSCPKISIAPSNEALTRAAELRARKGSLLATIGEDLELPLPPKVQVTQSAPPTARAASSFKQCSSSRPFDPNTPAETTMADELRLSRTDSPSHRPRAFTMPVESFGSETTVEDMPMQTGEGDPMATGSTAMELCTAEQNLSSSVSAVPGRHDGLSAHNRLPPNLGSGPSTWTPINNKQSQIFSTSMSESSKSACKSMSKNSKPTSQQKTSNTPESFERSAHSLSQTRLTSSFKASKPGPTTTDKSQSGSAPFVYRKKSKVIKGDVADTELQQQQPITQGGEKTPKAGYSSVPAVVSAVQTIPDASLMEGSAPSSTLNMSLVEEHINKKLPRSPGSARRSSSVKKAIRNEMRLSGADLSRAPGEQSSSQPDEVHEHSVTRHENEAQSPIDDHQNPAGKRNSAGQWPGTQVLLSRAQHDLFMSPDKIARVSASSPKEALRNPVDTSDMQPLEQSRKPLRQLSQEQMPGTQALMDNWSPWSTAKKPKPGKRASFVPSPLVSKNINNNTKGLGRSFGPGTKKPLVAEKAQETRRRRSSLRFSTSTAETPTTQRQTFTNIAAPETTSRPTVIDMQTPGSRNALSQSFYGPAQCGTSPGINLDFTLSNLSFAATAAQPLADADGSMVAWDSHDKVSCFQNAQRKSVDPDPEMVLTDLATELLSTAEFDSVVGRV